MQKGREKKGDDRKKERSYTKYERRKEMIERKKLQKGREKKGDERKKERKKEESRKDERRKEMIERKKEVAERTREERR